ncbi:MAG TPA: hypothetical protein VG326_11620 [Tepidisphaeraceae bacterium]|nr:hypothetical protein [Tepidisphaeraceae bacterium]
MGRQVRIAGLVRAAEMARRELSTPLTAAQRDRLKSHVDRNLQAVQRILREERGQIADMPAPSQRAYLFLAGLNWEKLAASHAATSANGQPVPTSSAPAEKITWRGLNTVMDRAMEALADDVSDDSAQGLGASIVRVSRQIELTMQRDAIAPDRLSNETRARRGWLAFFSQEENFQAYIQARRCASRLLDGAAVGSRHYPPPLTIHFRPVMGIYKLRSTRSGAVLWLPTPMIAFDEAGFAALASLIYDRGSGARQDVIGRMTGDGYQTVRAELESLGGIVEHSRGANHDLAVSFDRVNADYFNSTIARPTLTWNRTFTGRKFGHYDFVHDTLMVSRTLDSADVPEFVVDFLVFHELLHKFHGLHWVNGRGYAHTTEFHRDERKFANYEQAERVLKALAMRVR